MTMTSSGEQSAGVVVSVHVVEDWNNSNRSSKRRLGTDSFV